MVCAVSLPTLSATQGVLWLVALVFNPLSKIWLPHLITLGAGRRLPVGLPLLCLQAGISALLLAGPLVWIFMHTGSLELRIFVVIAAGGLLAAEASDHNRLPPVLATWLGAYFGTAALAAQVMPLSMRLAMWTALVIYGITLVKSSLEASLNLVRRCAAEFEAERQAQNINLLLDDFEASARDWFWESDADGRLTHVSTGMATALDRPVEALIGQSLVDVFAAPPLRDRLRLGRPFRDLVLPVQRHDTCLWLSVSAKPIATQPRHERPSWRGIGVDITESRRQQAELEHLSTHDALTDVLNRHGFQRLLQHAIDTADQRPVTLILLDLDRFKAINDVHGHGVGDDLLRAVATRLQQIPGVPGHLARLGGDEFALMQTGLPSVDAAAALATRLTETLHAPFLIADLRLDVRTSAGVATTPHDADTATGLLQAADMALYDAKEHGRNRARVYDGALGRRAHERAHLAHELARALERGGLYLHYQPLYRADDGQPEGAEALLRWTHPTLGAIPTDTLIDLAEHTGQIIPIGGWVLEEACRTAATWPARHRVAVNISARQLDHPGLLEQVHDALQDHGLPAHRLEIEVTESALLDRLRAAQRLAALRALGVRIVLDDFGTGFSSLSYLQDLRFDALKVDRSFVHRLGSGPGETAPAVVRAIVELARGLGLGCTAEGVEHAHQQQIMRALGCNTLQGFHFSRPVSAEAIGLILNSTAEPPPPASPGRLPATP
jgi:diguanylate cyclase (GGDEF)-like protein